MSFDYNNIFRRLVYCGVCGGRMDFKYQGRTQVTWFLLLPALIDRIVIYEKEMEGDEMRR